MSQIIPKIGNVEDNSKVKVQDEKQQSKCNGFENLKKIGINDIDEYIKTILEKRTDLIPMENVAGGSPYFTSIEFNEDKCLIYAKYEDGHYAGESVFQFQVDEMGNVEFKLLEIL